MCLVWFFSLNLSVRLLLQKMDYIASCTHWGSMSCVPPSHSLSPTMYTVTRAKSPGYRTKSMFLKMSHGALQTCFSFPLQAHFSLQSPMPFTLQQSWAPYSSPNKQHISTFSHFPAFASWLSLEGSSLSNLMPGKLLLVLTPTCM